jgi:hypothetical protein
MCDSTVFLKTEMCDERLKAEGEESTCLAYTGLLGELEHLKIETRFVVYCKSKTVKRGLKKVCLKG